MLRRLSLRFYFFPIFGMISLVGHSEFQRGRNCFIIFFLGIPSLVKDVNFAMKVGALMGVDECSWNHVLQLLNKI